VPARGIDDVRSALLERRVVLLSGELDGGAASELAATLLTLDATGDTRIELRMSSSHGPLDAALSVIDVIDVLGVPVHAIALGTIEGGPVGVLAACRPRRIAPHAVLRLREPDVQVAGTANDLERALAAQGARRTGFLEHLADRVGRPFAELDAEWSHGAVLEARDTVTLGYADEILAAGARRAPSDGTQ
jgi:ATP-dependent Clp protease, protease subunit